MLGVTSTSREPSSSSSTIPTVTSIAPGASMGLEAEPSTSTESFQEHQSSGQQAQPAASTSGAMPADITGANNSSDALHQFLCIVSCPPTCHHLCNYCRACIASVALCAQWLLLAGGTTLQARAQLGCRRIGRMRSQIFCQT